MIRIFILCVTVFWLFSCAEDSTYGPGQGPPNPQSTGGTTPGFDGYRGQPGDQNTIVTPPPNAAPCPAQGNWGGVTCNSNTDRDRNFLDFLSDKSNDKGIGGISCQPSNHGGVLVRMKVTLNSDFDPNGNNNNLVMQINSSNLELHIHDTKVSSDTPAIQVPFEGLSGEVNGNAANLSFIYNKGGVRKTVTLKGTFDANTFSGDISFENSVHLSGGRPARGLLGRFKIATCSVFTSI